MRELKTIQKRNKLNRVFSIDEIGPGNAYHDYLVVSDAGCQVPREQRIQFQKGPRSEEGSIAGVNEIDLLEIVRDRLKSFQEGDFRCRENACAITKIEEALFWLNFRAEERAERKVLGKDKK